jgi:phosphoglycerate dehydrogenase-like enzyme
VTAGDAERRARRIGGGRPRVAIGPLPVAPWAESAAVEAGAEIVEVGDAEALLWMSAGDPGALSEVLAHAPRVRWVHLRWAGIEAFTEAGFFQDGRLWTCGKGVFADAVAEHALALGLAGLRGLPARMRAPGWGSPSGSSLMGGRVTVLGGGGIATELARLLTPFRVSLTVVRRTSTPFPGAGRTLTSDRVDEALAGADLVILALPLTPETVGLIGASQLRRMESHAWLVNVARGAQVVTADLVTALLEGWIGGAALDVTDPEPLPADHPLWGIDRCVITPHTASNTEATLPAVGARIVENVRRFAAGEPLLGTVDAEAGY